MYSRLLKSPESKSFFLFGPRGTGKSSWVKQQFPDGIHLDLLESGLFHRLLASPQRLNELIPHEHRGWVILDEVQKVPEILDEVHRLIEKRKLKFVLTGSSARKLKRRGTNLLAGRALTLRMHPLTACELGKDFDLAHSLRFGSLPATYAEKEPMKYLESYVATYLKEEVQQEGLTRNLSAFSRFLEAASFSQGSILNISTVARDCSVERKVVTDYFGILEDLLLGIRIPPFAKKARRRLVSHPKFYFFDAGVFRAIRPRGPLDMPEEIEGIALETLVFQEIRALNDYLDFGYQIYYWRTSTGLEVDLVLYGERGIRAIEIKRSSRIRDADFRGLEAFLADYPMAKALFLYGGDRIMSHGKIEVIPLRNFFGLTERYL